MRSVKLKRILIVILLLVTTCWIYVEVINRNSKKYDGKTKSAEGHLSHFYWLQQAVQ